jgi:hypothetical protein
MAKIYIVKKFREREEEGGKRTVILHEYLHGFEVGSKILLVSVKHLSVS